MLILKLLITPVITLLLLQVWTEFKKSRLGFLWGFFWLIAWTSVGVILFYPKLTSYLADLLGIGRGIDVIIYLSIVGLFYLVFRLYLKTEKLNQKIAKLAQKEALQEKNE